MKRTIFAVALATLSLFGLAACQTPPPVAPAPAVTQTTLNQLLEVRAKELELEKINLMTMIKFAVDSDSEFAKGAVLGMSMGRGQGGASSGGSSTTQTIMAAQAQADATALRREEMAYANSWDKKALNWLGFGFDVVRFDKGLKFQKWSIGESNSQTRHMFDNLRGTQQDAYNFSSTAYGAGSAATLQGVAAGRAAATPAAETVPAE